MKALLFLTVIGIFIFCTVATSSCTKEKVPSLITSDCPDTISFSLQIAPMIETNCVSCHGVGNSTGYTLTDYSNIAANADDILNALRAEGGSPLMPEGGPALNDSLIQQFACWKDQGKMNN